MDDMTSPRLLTLEEMELWLEDISLRDQAVIMVDTDSLIGVLYTAQAAMKVVEAAKKPIKVKELIEALKPFQPRTDGDETGEDNPHEWREMWCGCSACLDANCKRHNQCVHVDKGGAADE